jgi:GDP-L-fucose synthase
VKTGDRIFVAGSRGLVGSALVGTLRSAGYRNLLLPSRDELDLGNRFALEDFFQAHRPQHVFMAAARVGGILANSRYPGDFIRENLNLAVNVIDAAHVAGVERLLYLGSSCIYPREAPQPMREEYLLTGPLEPTNQWYAIAKIAGVKMVEAYNLQYGNRWTSVMPTNLYGAGDNFDLQTGHVLPALIRKFHEAKAANSDKVVVWGTGRPRREFLHVDDLAAACLCLARQDEAPGLVNVGTGTDISIAELAELIAGVTGYQGSIEYDTSRPDGTPRKLLDISRMEALGWRPTISLEAGVRRTYEWYSTQAAGHAKPI